MKLIDLSGMAFGAWTVVALNGRDRFGQALWNCRCVCGETGDVTGGRLRRGDSKSCGCQKPEACRKAATKHGAATGGKLTPEYGAWMHMVERCERIANKSFKDYGGRGIRVEPEWRHDFDRFLSDMGPRPSPGHSIDRIDTNGNYGPGNCKWSTRDEQNNNRRNTVKLTIDGVTKTLSEWAKDTGINYETIRSRVAVHGWTPEEAVKTAARRSGRRPRPGPALRHPHGEVAA